jgi:chromosome segregation ATPase
MKNQQSYMKETMVYLVLLIAIQDELARTQSELEELRIHYQQLETSYNEIQGLLESLSQENNTIQNENQALNDKIMQIKEAVKSKIAQEIEKSESLHQENLRIVQENESLSSQLAQIASQVSELQQNDNDQELQYLRLKASELVEQNLKSEGELNRLREYLIEVEENSNRDLLALQSTVEEYRTQLSLLENERQDWQIMKEDEQSNLQLKDETLTELKNELVEANSVIHSLKQQIEVHQNTIASLQNVLSHFEHSNLLIK